MDPRDQKRYLLRRMAEAGSAGRAQVLAEQDPTYDQALAQTAGYPDAVAQTKQQGAQNIAARGTAQDAYLEALSRAEPLARAKVDQKLALERAKLDHALALEQRKMDVQRRQAMLAAEPERRRRVGVVDEEIAGIGGGRSPDEIRYHAQQMADARRRQSEINALRSTPMLHPDKIRQADEMQAALQRDIEGIGGGGLTPNAIDYHAQQLQSGEQRRAALSDRDAALAQILGEVGGDPAFGYEFNADLVRQIQPPSLQEQADAVKAQRIIAGEDGAKPTVREKQMVDPQFAADYEGARTDVENWLASGTYATKSEIVQALRKNGATLAVIEAVLDDYSNSIPSG